MLVVALLVPCMLLFAASSSALTLPPGNATGSAGQIGSNLNKRVAQPILNCKKKGDFAMTFDDGPYTYGHQIATVFQQHKSRATFFVNGYNYDCIYNYADELIARYKAGHMIGAHTWDHSDITTLSADQLHQQITLLETALQKILGVKPRYFRPPYGSYDDASLAIIESRGYQVVTWSFDSGDSTGSTTSQSISDYSQLYSQYPNPVMALNHETYAGTANDIVPTVVPKLLAAGYKLVTVAECLGQHPYQSVGKAGKRDATWTCDGTPPPGSG